MNTAARFAKSSNELARIARINNVGLDACWGFYNEEPNEKKAAEMLADSLSLAMRQLVFLNKEMLVLAIGTELDNAQTELDSLVRPAEQLDLFAES